MLEGYADKDMVTYGYNYRPCDVIRRADERNDSESSVRPANDFYEARVRVEAEEEDDDDDDDDEVKMAMIKRTVVMSQIPQSAIFFVDRPYTTDQAMRGAFRHEIEIPDDIFPDVWKDQL
uniref:Uncharacterized protein n=1 Tax=Odontella aurita TaxID=265563 RepID=A0A7S4IRF2_9STRA